MKEKRCEDCWSKHHTTHAHHVFMWESCNCPTPYTQEKEMDYDEFMHLTKPTQDTESWEEKFNALFTEYSHEPTLIRIHHFFRQELQQRGEEAFNRGYSVGEKMNIPVKKRLNEARTQGAEVAVEYISRIAWDGAVPDTKLVNNSILEQAKKV